MRVSTRRLVALLAAFAALAVPAAAQAHFDYYNVTLDPNEATFAGSVPPVTHLACWGTLAVGPGTTVYADGTQPNKWGLAEAYGFDHFHPLNWMDFDTGYSTRHFSGESAGLGTRYMVDAAGSHFTKFVQDGGSHTVVVRKNC